MKNKFYLFIIFLCSAVSMGQNYYMATPQGFGASATGGGNATPIVVSTFTDLRNALLSTSASTAVIVVSGTIDCTYMSIALNNKTILGLPGARLRNNQITVGNSTTSAANSGILNIKPGSNNVIIRNLIFEGPGAYDVDGRDNLTNEGTNIWVDHCEFQDGMDGNFDNKGQADNVTISWCKFTYLKPAIPGGSGGSNDHRFTNLVGSSSTDAPTDGHYSITFQNCYWASGCKERMPRARNAELHILNCYYNTGVSSSKAIGLGGGINNSTCYVQNTNFANVTSVFTSYVGSDGGTIGVSFNNCLNGTSNLGTVTAPSYSATTIPVNDVANYITDSICGAGATLQVTNGGTVSPNDCAFLSGNNFESTNLQFYTTNSAFNIQFTDELITKAKISIFSLNGQIIYTNSNFEEKHFVLNIDNFSNGVYFCRVEKDNKVAFSKFVKN